MARTKKKKKTSKRKKSILKALKKKIRIKFGPKRIKKKKIRLKPKKARKISKKIRKIQKKMPKKARKIQKRIRKMPRKIHVKKVKRIGAKKPEPFQPALKDIRWNTKLEGKIFSLWQKEKLFVFNPKERKPLFSIDTPPPYVNTPVHIGQAYTYVWMDMFARFKRMMGFNVLFPMGLDKNGLPIEVQTEKEFGISMHETPRDEFIKKCKRILKKSGDISLDAFKQLGLSCNSWILEKKLGGRYDTDNPEYRKLTQETFINLWNRGLIYEDMKPTNYCTVCRTAISDAEVEYEEGETELNYIKFLVKGTGDFVSIATTRPELLCTCKLIIYHPDDERYKYLEGQTAVVPLYENEVPIIPHPYAKPEFGTGLVMICSFGDYGDIRLLRELDIKPTYAINPDGTMNDNAGNYSGLTVQEARKRIIEELRLKGSLERQLKIQQRQPLCWRSKNTVEFVPMREFYLKQVEFKDDILKLSEQMKFYASESRQRLIDWISTINIDWVISRRRYYGTEIPLWHCRNCNFIYIPKPGRYYQPWIQDPDIKVCPKCQGNEFIGETRTFDTWFDSSNSEIYILGYLWSKEFFKRNFPCSLRPQGKEIIRTWLYFTLLKSYHLFKKPPFRDVWINHHVLDEKGEKMSKSKGNVIDPHDVIKRFGSESFRIWSCLEGDIAKDDIRCSFERIQGTAKFLTKLWNISNFISSFPQIEQRYIKLLPQDRWILAEFNRLESSVKQMYNNYQFSEAAIAIRDFAWNLFAAHYIEMVKKRAYGENGNKNDQRSAWFALHNSLKILLKLLSPVIPFITDHIWRELYSKKSIHIEKWPEIDYKSELINVTKNLIDFNSLIWNGKKELNLSLKDPVSVTIPKNLKSFENDLIAMHTIDTKAEHRIRLKPEKEKKEEPKVEELKKVEKKRPKKVKKKKLKKVKGRVAKRLKKKIKKRVKKVRGKKKLKKRKK